MRTFTNQFLFKNRLAKKCALTVEAASGAAEARRLLAKNVKRNAGSVKGWLDVLNIGYDVLWEDGAEFPKSGPVLVLANHPSGVLDGLILLDLCLSIRRDVKILARGALRDFGDTGGVIIPLPANFGRCDWAGHLEAKRQAQNYLDSGGMVIVFGGGVVNRWYRMKFTEGPWSSFVGKLSARPQVRVIPVLLEIQCSWLYKFVSFFSISGQRMLLLREVLVKRGRRFPVIVGRLTTIDAVESKISYRTLAMSFRDRVLRLGSLSEKS